MKILIPNCSSPKNIGDLAILTGLLRKVDAPNITIHSADHTLHTSLPTLPSPTLYSWAIFENKNPAVRIKRLTELLLHVSTLGTHMKRFRSPKLSSLMKDYETASIVLFTGGGYLRTQKGITQTLNLLMLLLMFYAALRLKKKIIVSPISFGPFAYRWQEKLSALTLKKCTRVYVREKTSHALLTAHQLKNVNLSVDTSLFLPVFKNIKEVNNPFVLGFTIRAWLSLAKQKEFEKEFAASIVDFCNITKSITRPIIQVDAPEYGDVDVAVTKRIIKNLKQKGVKVLPMEKVISLKHAQIIYSDVNLLLGMRMHSNILAALAGTPFIAIAYEHKTAGIADVLGVADYCIDVNNVTKEKLLDMLLTAHKNQTGIKTTMQKNILRLQKTQTLVL